MTATKMNAYNLNPVSYEYGRELRRRNRRMRRRMEVRKKIVMLICSAIMILVLSLSYHAIISNANADLENISYKYYTSIMVENGETLWSLAQEYADEHYSNLDSYVKEVMQINHLEEETIKAGEYLVLPYYSTLSTSDELVMY